MNPVILWLNRLAAFASTPAVVGIFLSGAAIYLIAEWRIRFLAQIAQYFFIGILFARIFDTRLELALLKIMVGWLISGAFLISAMNRDESVRGQGLQMQWSSNVPFRILSLLTMTVVALLGAQRYVLPFIPADLALACYLLVVLALLFIGTEEEHPVLGGVGILNLLAALDLFYSAQDPGLLITGMLVIVNLLVGLAISYITVAEVAE